jgi:hypothetical protein
MLECKSFPEVSVSLRADLLIATDLDWSCISFAHFHQSLQDLEFPNSSNALSMTDWLRKFHEHS